MPSAAVLGKPVHHSLSPVLHRAAYDALGLAEWSYSAIECDEAALAGLVRSSGPDVAGYSCTMPLKREVLRVADSVSARAAAIGAGNTLLQVDGEWFAENTDWIGIAQALAETGVPEAAELLLLGAGGTAQAALAVVEPGSQVTVLVRDIARAEDLHDAAGRLEIEVQVHSLDRIGELAPRADVLISTLPGGAADALVGSFEWQSRQVLLDVVYAGWPTALAASAEAAGVAVASGALMLLHQAVRQVELMTGLPVAGTAAEQAMREALRHAAPQSGL